MKLALLDLGSNTIKLAVYELHSGGFTQSFYDASYIGVIGYVRDGILLPEGTARIVQTLLHYRKIAAEHGCEKIDCFSTASLRGASNRDEVCREVLARTGILIEPISGEQEARYNFRSMQLVAGAEDFVGADLGGGSIQLFCCQKNSLTAHQSFPLGALKLHHDLVQGELPTSAEAEKIRERVRETLQNSTFYTGFTVDTLLQMGGTARMIRMILHQGDVFETAQLQALLEEFLDDPQRARDTIDRTIPERKLTLLPGMLVIHEVCRLLGVKQIRYTQSSVREGYLCERYRS